MEEEVVVGQAEVAVVAEAVVAEAVDVATVVTSDSSASVRSWQPIDRPKSRFRCP